MSLKIINLKENKLYPGKEILTQDVYDRESKTLVKGGMFCPEVFGDEEEWQGLVPKGSKFPTVARWDRMATVKLPVPVTVVGEDRLAVYTGLSLADAVDVIDGNRLLLKRSGEDGFSLIAYSEAQAVSEGDEIFVCGEAVRALIAGVDEKSLSVGSEEQQGLYRELESSGESPSDWVVDEVPVLPPEFRPITVKDDKHYLHVMNDSYRKVISRSIRMKKMLTLDAPRLIVWNEAKLLQRAVNELIGGLKGETNPDRCSYLFKETDRSKRFIGLVNAARRARRDGCSDEVLDMMLYAAFRRIVR